ncbi:Hemolysin, contains CBS domains [Gracilibacillus orientalis]|uniref:Hemolysin, contains CBS domains n=1 Tax=Gracilibacillus orientalis TaxID=334253 RepID=A0A1I4JQC9_9BACI|nr:hemolysin family protein [Gracilibacillus orientalis]SFL68740.1 Hemolysin, contains CBS domains [Gracilibacillus orientalis]
MEIINLIIVAILIILTAFFVASEFAIVKIRKSRVRSLVKQGKAGAKSAEKVTNSLDGYLAACQLGITVTALGIGWLGEPAIAQLLHPVFESLGFSATVISTISFIIAFLFITFLHVVIGELAPKSFSIQKTEKVTLLLSPLLVIFHKVMYPFIWALNGSARIIVRMFGLPPASESGEIYSEDEVRSILATSYKSGEINASEIRYLNNVFEFDERVAKEVMIPRTEIICLYQDNTYQANLDILKAGKYTRYPVADKDKDHIVGIINTKEFFKDFLKEEQKGLTNYIKPIIHATENTPINAILKRLQKRQNHMAIVVDEYGGTAGLITMEDIIEEVFGEIQDELDVDERPMYQKINEYTYLLNGKLLISETNELLNTDIDDNEIDTIGGWFLNQRLDPVKGTTMEYNNYKFTIKDVDGHQIRLIEAKQINTEEKKHE